VAQMAQRPPVPAASGDAARLLEQATTALAALQMKTQAEMAEVEAQRRQLEAEKVELARKDPIDSEVIEISVGNQVFVTMKTTLCKFEGSTLAALFSGRHPLKTDSNGRFVIDRSPKTFGFVLEFLQYGRARGVPGGFSGACEEEVGASRDLFAWGVPLPPEV